MEYKQFYALGKKYGLPDHEITYMYIIDNAANIIKNKYIPKKKKGDYFNYNKGVK